MVSESQYQAPDDVLRMWDEILSFYEINKVNNMKFLVILFLIKITGINFLVANSTNEILKKFLTSRFGPG